VQNVQGLVVETEKRGPISHFKGLGVRNFVHEFAKNSY
jgi:hypothetical protein